jgi:hypothetical protein
MTDAWVKFGFNTKTKGEICGDIVSLINKQKLSRNELETLISILREKEYFTIERTKFIRKEIWNRDYLHSLLFVPAQGVYTSDYLLHLFEVAEFVNSMEQKKDKQKKLILGVAIAVVAIGIIIIIAK